MNMTESKETRNVRSNLTSPLHYVGARYVPSWYDLNDGNWEDSTPFQALMIVRWNDHYYISKKPVPNTVGEPQDNPEYWKDMGESMEKVKADLKIYTDQKVDEAMDEANPVLEVSDTVTENTAGGFEKHDLSETTRDGTKNDIGSAVIASKQVTGITVENDSLNVKTVDQSGKEETSSHEVVTPATLQEVENELRSEYTLNEVYATPPNGQRIMLEDNSIYQVSANFPVEGDDLFPNDIFPDHIQVFWDGDKTRENSELIGAPIMEFRTLNKVVYVQLTIRTYAPVTLALRSLTLFYKYGGTSKPVVSSATIKVTKQTPIVKELSWISSTTDEDFNKDQTYTADTTTVDAGNLLDITIMLADKDGNMLLDSLFSSFLQSTGAENSWIPYYLENGAKKYFDVEPRMAIGGHVLNIIYDVKSKITFTNNTIKLDTADWNVLAFTPNKDAKFKIYSISSLARPFGF